MRQIFISLFVLLIFSAGLSLASESGYQSLVGEGQDIFYQTPGAIEGPAAAESPRSYSAIPFVNNRLVVWLAFFNIPMNYFTKSPCGSKGGTESGVLDC